MYAALIAWLLVATRSIANRMGALADHLGALLPVESDRPLRQYLQNQFRRRRQVVICLLGALMGATATAVALELFLESHTSWSHQPPGWSWYVVAFAGGIFAVDGVSWIVRLPFIVKKLFEADRLSVVMHAPAETPGIRALNGLYALSGFWAAGGFFLVSLPFLWAMLIIDDTTFVYVSAGAMLLVLVTVVWVALGAEWWLSRLVGRERDRIAREIARALPKDRPMEMLDSEYEKIRSVYDNVAAASVTSIHKRDYFAELGKILIAISPIALGLIDQLSR